MLFTAVPFLVERLGGCPTPTTRQASGGGPPLKFYEDRDILSHVQAMVAEPYLGENEGIIGLLHGVKDNYDFYCPCHFAHVVYTTRRRLICMSCGFTHLVLRDEIPLQPKQVLTAEDWDQLFGENGSRRDEEIALEIVDFRDIEKADAIWVTDQWLEATQRFNFFTRSTLEEIKEAIRGTESDPSILLEAGFSPVRVAPPPSRRLSENLIDVDLVENAAHAFSDGVTSFLDGYTASEHLVIAVPQLFRSIELLLKARLEVLSPGGLQDHPNNPTVLKRLSTLNRARRVGAPAVRWPALA